jgi:hypothetical protein
MLDGRWMSCREKRDMSDLYQHYEQDGGLLTYGIFPCALAILGLGCLVLLFVVILPIAATLYFFRPKEEEPAKGEDPDSEDEISVAAFANW